MRLLRRREERGALVILARINKYFTKEDEVAISNYLDERLVLFLPPMDRDEALNRLVDKLSECGKLLDRDAFFSAILQREKIVSTGIGMGVAVPHAKLFGYSDFFIAIGLQVKPGIEWHSIDSAPARLIFMIGGPENRQTEYLHILSRLTAAIKDEERRKKLLKAKTAQEVIALFEGC
jgi:PTS system nitrogen regulatory IIA component